MKTNRTLLLTALGVAAVAFANPAIARGNHDNHDSRASSNFTDYARVVSVEPLRRSVRVSTPVRQCWNEPVTYSEPVQHRGHRGGRSYTSPILGSIVGGVVGHQFGKGSGKTLLTVAGAVLGASVGNDVGQRGRRDHGYQQRARTYTVNEERCSTEDRYHTEERVDGYLVEYSYKGRIYSTQMDHHPGKRIPVTVQVAPRY
jgi:uncharacterized protein YcfJ